MPEPFILPSPYRAREAIFGAPLVTRTSRCRKLHNLANAVIILDEALALALLLVPATAYAESAEIEHRCTAKYPSMTQYFAWKDCVKTPTQREPEENLKCLEEDFKRQKEEAARACLAADIARMEG